MKKIIFLLIATIAVACQSEDLSYLRIGDSPIFPDYRNVTVPGNIAPFNFDYIGDIPTRVDTYFEYGNGQKVHFRGKNIRWKTGEWRKMLSESKGGVITVHNSIGDKWNLYVSNDDIDYGLQYRLVSPGYQVFGSMSIRERSLSDFKERVGSMPNIRG